MRVGYNKGDIMVRRTRVNCKICKSFDGNDVCKKCYNKTIKENKELEKENKGLHDDLLHSMEYASNILKKLKEMPVKKVFRCDLCGDSVDNYDEKNLCYKCSKEFKDGYKKLGKEYIVFPLYVISLVIFAFSGAIALYGVISAFSFSNWIFSINLNVLFSHEMFLNLIALVICVLFNGAIINSLYISRGD